MTAAYVHVPFCARVCPYCDFAVVAGKDELTERYFDALLAEIDMEPAAGPLESVFIGGGTPSRVAPELLKGVIDRLAERFGLVDDVEVSLEANPEDWTPGVADGFSMAGINRVSFGVQSFDDEVLAGLGRMHTAPDGGVAVARARGAGFDSVSLDLIFSSPGESPGSWAATVETAIALQPDHISTYALTVERGTELSRQVLAGAAAPDPDDQADKYELARTALVANGFTHYEVSNYARPGHECRYNLNTWRQGDYLAFGLGAHGHRDGVRRRNVRRFEAYLDMVEQDQPPEAGREVIAAWDAELERVFLGVRMRTGVAAGAIGPALAADPEGQALVEAGKLEVTANSILVLDPLFTDAVARVVLGLARPSDTRVTGNG
ncbi:MAG: radical SAM family heme chaperone HemW [Acidimicrobiia bacterium]|nr:radical SAM family heme chaperone HemW [Acidimicrobiia bacterium]